MWAEHGRTKCLEISHGGWLCTQMRLGTCHFKHQSGWIEFHTYLCPVPFHHNVSKTCVQPSLYRISAFDISNILRHPSWSYAHSDNMCLSRQTQYHGLLHSVDQRSLNHLAGPYQLGHLAPTDVPGILGQPVKPAWTAPATTLWLAVGPPVWSPVD